MTPAAAAKQWLGADDEYADAKRRRDEAADVLKPFFCESGKSTYRGVSYARSTYKRLDATLARKLLGKRAVEAEVESVRETLSRAA